MQKVYCYVENSSGIDEEPIIIFETCCLPRVNETMLLRGKRYVIKRVDHRFREDYGMCKHEVVIIIKRIFLNS